METKAQQADVPDGGYGWVVVFCTFMIFMVFGGSFVTFSILLIDFSGYFDKTQAELGFVGSIETALQYAIVLPSAPLCERYGSRVVAMCGLGIMAFGYLAAAFSTNFFFMVLFFSFTRGFGMGLLYVPGNVIVQKYFNKWRPLAAGLASCGMSVGTLVFGPVQRILTGHIGWQGTLMMMSAFCIQCLVFAALYRPPPSLIPRRSTIYKPTANGDGAVAECNGQSGAADNGDIGSSVDFSERGAANKRKKKQSLCVTSWCCVKGGRHGAGHGTSRAAVSGTGGKRQIFNLTVLRDHTFLLYAFGRGICIFGPTSFYKLSTTRAIHYGIEPLKASFLVAAIGVSSTFGRFTSGALATSSPRVNSGLLNSSAMVLGAFAILISIIPREQFMYHVICNCIYGVFLGTFESLHPTVTANLFGMDNLAHCLAWVSLVIGICALVSLPIYGHLFDITGNYTAPFVLAGVIQLLGGVFCTVATVLKQRQKAAAAAAAADAGPAHMGAPLNHMMKESSTEVDNLSTRQTDGLLTCDKAADGNSINTGDESHGVGHRHSDSQLTGVADA